MEVHCLCAVLNSDIVDKEMKPLQPRGLYGERDIHRRPLMLPIHMFNPSDKRHIKLAELSRSCHAKISSVSFAKKKVDNRRKETGLIIKEELKEIDKLVTELLGLSSLVS